MKHYGLNKIFVEGKSDKLFVDFLLQKFFEIEDNNLVVDVRGKDKLIDQPFLYDTKRIAENAKNIVVFDTDSSKTNAGRNQRIHEIKNIEAKLNTKFEIYLLPFNDETEGILEDLLITCINSNFGFFDECWNTMINCISNSGFENLNIPAQKGFVFSKIDLFKNYRSCSWEIKGSTVYDYFDVNIWNINSDENNKLKKLLDFINDNLFND